MLHSRKRTHLRHISLFPNIRPPIHPDPRVIQDPTNPVTTEQLYPKLVTTMPRPLKDPIFKRPKPPEPTRAFFYVLPDLLDPVDDITPIFWTTTISIKPTNHEGTEYHARLHRFFYKKDLLAEQYEWFEGPLQRIPRDYHKYTRRIHRAFTRRGFRIHHIHYKSHDRIDNLDAGEPMRTRAQSI